MLLERGHRRRLDEIDGAATKSASGHACPDHARLGDSNLHQQVELLGAHFVIVAKAAMRVAHQPPEPAEIAGFKSVHGALDATIFRDDMMTTRIYLWAQKPAVLF